MFCLNLFIFFLVIFNCIYKVIICSIVITQCLEANSFPMECSTRAYWLIELGLYGVNLILGSLLIASENLLNASSIFLTPFFPLNNLSPSVINFLAYNLNIIWSRLLQVHFQLAQMYWLVWIWTLYEI